MSAPIFKTKKDGSWTRDYLASLRVQSHAGTINQAYHRQQAPTDAQLEEARKRKHNAETLLATKFKEFSELEKRLDTGAKAPAHLTDAAEEALASVYELENYSANRFTNMQAALDKSKHDITRLGGIEARSEAKRLS